MVVAVARGPLFEVVCMYVCLRPPTLPGVTPTQATCFYVRHASLPCHLCQMFWHACLPCLLLLDVPPHTTSHYRLGGVAE